MIAPSASTSRAAATGGGGVREGPGERFIPRGRFRGCGRGVWRSHRARARFRRVPRVANRAAARLKLGDASGALADATEATRLDPKHARARHRRAVALSSLGRHVEAAAEYDAVERDIPNHAGVKAEAAAAREKARAEQARAEQARAEEPKVATPSDASPSLASPSAASPSPVAPPRTAASSTAAKSPASAASSSPASKEAIAAKAAAAAALVSERKRASKRERATEHEHRVQVRGVRLHCPSSSLGCLTMSSRAW